jgi:hypothetical protein
MKPLLMLSLPNSGSTWLADLLHEHVPGCRPYFMEFFNPLRNEKHEDVLRRQFGCELVGCYRNIAWAGGVSIDADIEQTWGRESYAFTKEVWSPTKLPAFVRHFRCFVIVRSAEESFPPSRLRVWSFYEHAWFALRDAGWQVKAERTRARALEAHGLLVGRMVEDAAALGVPVVRYRDLFSRVDRLSFLLERAIGAPCVELARAIRGTRERRPRVAV